MGATWRELGGSPRFADGRGFKLKRVWTIDEAPSGVLYTGVDEAALFRSADAGETWSEVASLSDHPTRPHWSPWSSPALMDS